MKLTKYDKTAAKQGAADYFTGTVVVDSPFASQLKDSYSGAMVNFAAGARTVWHSHPQGQTIIIISGEGRAQTDGGEVEKLEVGDVVWFPPNTKHWHGAATHSPMSHIAIVEGKPETATDWLEPVADKDYLAG